MPLSVPTLTTDRLVVRPFAFEDLGALHRLAGGDSADAQPALPASTGAAGGAGLDGLSRRRRWLEWTILSYGELAGLAQPPYGDRAVVLRASGELIGQVGYVPSYMPFGQLGEPFRGAPGVYSPEVGLFWAIATPHRGRGYAAEAARALIAHAFGALSLGRIVATTEHANLASQAVMRKLGMTILRNPLDAPPWLQVVGVLEKA